jgi:hypothetical protein
LGGIDEIEFEALGVSVESIGETAQKPHRGGTEDGQPVRFDIGRARVVTELIDDWVAPGLDRIGGGGFNGIDDESHSSS